MMFASMIIQLVAFMVIIYIRNKSELTGDRGDSGPSGSDGEQGRQGANYDAKMRTDMKTIRGDMGMRGRKGNMGYALWDTREYNHRHIGSHGLSTHTHPGTDPDDNH